MYGEHTPRTPKIPKTETVKKKNASNKIDGKFDLVIISLVQKARKICMVLSFLCGFFPLCVFVGVISSVRVICIHFTRFDFLA